MLVRDQSRIGAFMTLHSLIPTEAKLQAPFVQKVDSAIHRINHYRH